MPARILTSAERDLLIDCASLSRSALAPVLSARSDPARSDSCLNNDLYREQLQPKYSSISPPTILSFPTVVRLEVESYASTMIAKMECDRLLSAFIMVAPVWRSKLPFVKRSYLYREAEGIEVNDM